MHARKCILWCLIIFQFLFFQHFARAQNAFLKDDFESTTLSPIWSTFRLAKNALHHVTSFIRSGKGALEICLQPYDKKEIGRDGEWTERDELTEAPEVRLHTGEEVWYAFSFLLPSNFPIVDTRLVIAQWKQACRDCAAKRSPMVSLRYYEGKLRVFIESDRGRRKLYNQQIDLRNRWVDMIFRLVARPDKNGVLQVWKDSEQIVNYSGNLGYKDEYQEMYFKMGLYRNHMDVPMCMIVDRFRRGNNLEAVSAELKN